MNGAGGAGSVPNSATQQSASLKSAAQAALKQTDKPTIINQTNNNNNTSEISGMQRRSVIKQDQAIDPKYQHHVDQQSSKGNLQGNNVGHYIPTIGGGIAVPQNHLSNSAQRKQQMHN